ncbi:uncharacterized protein BO80DRAFT_19809 [Aspergillus ibericus CBS 121593]|uniref:Uncharacterized protein n=1 Tax=Aspergillus ibericus CBS 121593 TaxID=1448316 RepID=A0A395H5T6_9EURO|nr:hypothetical protein BO80DRAFT_19809 [Aspergillus ibericus CBS 121593]RAL02879.1 hypothetical protein BO80DRAFT_19809 [Aspergillus ibericus CBS 121593]
MGFSGGRGKTLTFPRWSPMVRHLTPFAFPFVSEVAGRAPMTGSAVPSSPPLSPPPPLRSLEAVSENPGEGSPYAPDTPPRSEIFPFFTPRSCSCLCAAAGWVCHCLVTVPYGG